MFKEDIETRIADFQMFERMGGDRIAAGVQSDIEQTVSKILAERPFMESILRPFAVLFRAKALVSSALRGSFHSTDFDVDIFKGRFYNGIPLLTGFSFASIESPMNWAFSELLPFAKACFPVMFQNLERIESARADASFDLVRLSEGYLNGSLKGFAESPSSQKVVYPNAGFVVHLVLSAVIESMRPFPAEKNADVKWRRGYCPVCGMLPSISFIPMSSAGAETLLYLHCSLCGKDWPIQDGFCTVCERETTEERIRIRLLDKNSERVDVCIHCGYYLPCIDLRTTDTSVHLDTMAVGMAHLDFMAQQKGFSPIVRAPWNTFR